MGRDPIEQLYEDVGGLVLRRSMRMLDNHQEALEVTQWTFLRAIETGFEVRSRPEALVWLYRTATQRCLHLLRSGSTRRRLQVAYAGDLEAGAQPSPEAILVGRDTLARALADVDDRTGEIALLTWSQGLSNERVAEMLGVSVRTVGRARATFEESLRHICEEAS